MQIKYERKLMNRFLIGSRIGPDIDLPKYLGMCELSVLPLSLFTLDGSLYYPEDEEKIATELQNLQAAEKNQSIDEGFSSNATKVTVIDEMAIVNEINIANSQIRTCDCFSK